MKAAFALLFDNAVAQKDTLILGRHKGALAASFVTLTLVLLVTGAIAIAVVEAVQATAYRGELWPHGRTLTAAVTVAALCLGAVLVPALTATSVVVERESGTLRLLLTTALTPGAIVIGKLLACLKSALPALLLLLPVLAGGALLGAVSLVDVLLAAGLLVVCFVTLASVGVAASACSHRVREASSRALGAALVVTWVPVVGPAAALVIAWAFAGYRSEMVPGAVYVLAAAAVVTVGSLLMARDALCPKSAPRRSLRRHLLTATLVAGPTLAALSSWAVPAGDRDTAWSTLFLLAWGGMLVVVVIVDGALARRGGDERGAARAGLDNVWRAALGLSLAVPVAALALSGSQDAFWAVLRAASDVGLVLMATMILASLITSLSTQTLRSPSRRVGAAVVTLGVVWVLPVVLTGLPVLSGLVPLTDPASLIDAITSGVVRPLDAPFANREDALLSSGGGAALTAAALLSALLLRVLREARERVARRR